MVKYIQQKQKQKQQRQQHKNLLWQFIQLSIPMPRDAKGLSIPPTPISHIPGRGVNGEEGNATRTDENGRERTRTDENGRRHY